MSRMRWVLLPVALLLATAAVVAQSQPINYIYDELGRLVAVIDPNGDSAAYAYDAVGNILSITRRTASQVSVVEFTPNSGPVGTTVTISGTAFSTTPAQNTVTFNGVSATVTTATANQLVVTVPTGAATGAIGVTSPAGSASSGTNFVVGSSAPSISGFTPGIGAAGTSVTVSGSNFQTLASHDRVNFNISPATLSSASTTSIVAAVPPTAGSGRIAVETPYGKATSATDFFIPPLPLAVSDVAGTGRMPLATATALSIPTAQKVGLMVFDAAIGERISIRGSNATFSSAVNIYKPTTALLAGPYTFSTTGWIDPFPLNQTGTYTILVDPLSTGTGSITLTAYSVPPDVAGTITAGGSAQPVSISTPGQNAKLSFAGSANQRVSLQGTSSTINISTLSVLKPDGSVLGSPASFTPNGFLDTLVLPSTGTYAILEDPLKEATGSISLTLYDVPADYSGSITPGGSAVTATITTPGQNGALTFTGVAQNRISLRGTSGSIAINNVSIKNPDGSNLATPTAFTPNGFIDTKTLPASGTYNIVLDPLNANTGNTTLTLYNVPADYSTGTVIGYAPVLVPIGTPGQNGAVTFSSSALRIGQVATVHVTSNTFTLVTVKLLSPSGAVMSTMTSGSSNFDLPGAMFTASGTHTISIDPFSYHTGQLYVSVTAEDGGGGEL
jgi:YD repeat-containing protein